MGRTVSGSLANHTYCSLLDCWIGLSGWFLMAIYVYICITWGLLTGAVHAAGETGVRVTDTEYRSDENHRDFGLSTNRLPMRIWTLPPYGIPNQSIRGNYLIVSRAPARSQYKGTHTQTKRRRNQQCAKKNNLGQARRSLGKWDIKKKNLVFPHDAPVGTWGFFVWACFVVVGCWLTYMRRWHTRTHGGGAVGASRTDRVAWGDSLSC
ncbi:hypothetical protein BDP81DRAFT_424791 [Colletotrichum phormii]|uniref:Uncharacterized protein n=1 Tax=Colletotrichum phormii TaxID=359342 RepID=A0AAI9ZUB3_9PEZI|nr:uncharacterized protein BDP81DRAFT_424791 [Colletotrichum phormii]KAK1638344.1 hypothetical protein BDP81DRAFT_424791 [Colletotrichum phormii]